MVLVGYGFINCLASESFVVSFSWETENLKEAPSALVKQLIHDLVASCIVIDIDNLLVKIWK